MSLYPPVRDQDASIMLFADGENFAIRYENMLRVSMGRPGTEHEPGILVWSEELGRFCNAIRVRRKHYYTSVVGDEPRLLEITDTLKRSGIEAPRVFKRTKDRASKRVDISLATEMLGHAHRGNYDVAVLIAGDQDYLPLIEAVQREGKLVWVWALSDGLSPDLVRVADHYGMLDPVMFR